MWLPGLYAAQVAVVPLGIVLSPTMHSSDPQLAARL